MIGPWGGWDREASRSGALARDAKLVIGGGEVSAMIRYEVDSPVTTLTLSRPPVNAMDYEFVTALNAALDRIEVESPTLVVIRSDQKCLCAGADLNLIRGFLTSHAGIEQMVSYVQSLHSVFNRLEALEAVTLCAIDGAALGGGLELTLACDLRLATPRAKIGLPEARVGQIPGAGGTQRLTRLAGPGVAARLILGAEIVDGPEAARLGIVQWACASEALDAKIQEIATRVAGLSRGPLVAAKRCMAAWFDPALDGFAMEIETPRTLMRTEEARRFVNAFFNRNETAERRGRP